MDGDNAHLSCSRPLGFVSPWPMAVVLGVAYYIGARLGLIFTVEGSGISVFWFPNAVTLAALLVTPKARWPHLVVGSWMGDIAAEVVTSGIADALVFSVANLAQTLICAFVLRKASINPIHNPRHYLLFLFCYVGLVAPAGSALVTLYVSLDPAATGLWAMWRSWWLGDALYVMTLTPLILALVRPSDSPIRGCRSEAVMLAAALAGASFIDFFVMFPNEHVLSNLALPLLLWVALRFGLRGAGLAVSMLVAVAGFPW